MEAALPSTPAASSLTPSTKSLSFDTTELTAPTFTPQSFISSVRVHAPLRVVRDDLRAHLATLQAELVACVQRDFQTFTNFGPAISDADALAETAAEPLSSLRKEIMELLTSLDEQIADLDSTLLKRREALARTSALRTLIDANDLLIKCERLLKEYSTIAAKASMEGLRLVERIASESAQLSFTLSRAVDGAFVKNIAVRISAVRRGVRTCLETWLRRALFPKEKAESVYDNDVLVRVLNMYVVCGMVAEAEEYFRREVVVPFTSTRLRMTPMLAVADRKLKVGKEDVEGVTVSAADALEAAVAEVIEFLGDKVMPIVSLCETEERLRTKLDFVGRAVWPQIQKAIAMHMSAAFSPGIPDVFHQSVLAGNRLYAAIESAVGEGHKDMLRASEATGEFWKHWNLPVYFQLRFQEVTSKFDQHLNQGPVAVTDDSWESGSALLRTDVYRAVPTASLVASLRRCWSEEVFLESLTHRFLRLSLQLLARYSTWVRTGLAGEWTNADAVPKGAVRVFYDITMVQKRVPAELASVLRLRATGLSSEALDDVEAAFAEATDRYSELLPELSRSISDVLSRSCVENLQPLRGILATYRMSSKQAPSTHSTFVPKILRPLKTFLKDSEDAVQEGERLDIVVAVVEQTSAEYFNMATDLLQRNKSSEATLRRLNIGRSGALGGRGGGTTSVIEKISMQLYLDVAKFRDDVKALGVDLDSIASLGRLWDSVKREDTSEAEDDKSRSDAQAGSGQSMVDADAETDATKLDQGTPAEIVSAEAQDKEPSANVSEGTTQGNS